MTQEALKLALDALENHTAIKHPQQIHYRDKAITAIKEALAQPEQEPVAWVSEDVCEGQYIDGRPRKIWWECEKGVGTAFYTHPLQRTEQEPWCMKMNGCTAKCEDCPDAVALPCCGYTDANAVKLNPLNGVVQCHNCGQNYTTSQRTWVGLASEDRLTAKYMQDAPSGIEAVIDYIEAKLKEKNT
jgi:hypothetical protein